MKKIERDYVLAEKVAKFNDDMLLGPEELAAFLGVSAVSIKTGRVRVPPRIVGLNRKMQWRVGDVRAFVREQKTESEVAVPRRRGRPTKEQQIERSKA